jgi:hypothetical protein
LQLRWQAFGLVLVLFFPIVKNPANSYDAIILGAGAAGLLCAAQSAQRGRRVALLERADRIGKKILISGGGRCNFTNLHCTPENFLSENPDFARSALARYTPADFIALVRKHRIAFHEKTLGQLFCDDSATQITTMLETECREAGVQLFLNSAITEVIHDQGFLVRSSSSSAAVPFAIKGASLGSNPSHSNDSSQTSEFRAPALIVATGGLSIPKMGATGFGYDIARQFSIPIEPCRPALVPLTLSGAELMQFARLAGVSAPVVAACGKERFSEKMLFTHRGLSGPAILQISSYWNKPEPIHVDWSPGQQLLAPLRAPNAPRDLAALKAALRAHLPVRLVDSLIEVAAPKNWTNHALDELEHRLHSFAFTPSGTEGYEKAEVTAGGVSTNALSAQTMKCRSVRGLYFIGEVVDVTGQLGGFNFQWAWASGAAAGRAV